MIKYSQTVNNLENSEIKLPKISGYKKQFSIELPRGEEEPKTEEPVVEQPVQEPVQVEETPKQETPKQETPKPEVVTPPVQEEDFTEEEKNILLNDGSARDKSRVASKYLQKKLGLSKEQAAALIGVWQAESAFDLNAENKLEKAGKSKYVKANEYGIGIGQWTGPRHHSYVSYINNNGGKNNLKTQLDFAIQEIQNNYSDYLKNLRTASNVKDATAYTYAQYVAAGERNIKNLDDLYQRVAKIEKKYQAAHKSLYGKAGSGNFDRRVRFANDSLLAKMGIKLPMFQSGGALSNFNFDNIYKNSSDQIKALQRELGVKDDGIIGKRTISAIQKKVGTKVDGIWGKNSTAAAKQYVSQSKVTQPEQVMPQVSSTYVRKPLVPEMRLATDNEVVPAAGMKELPDYSDYTVVFPENWNGKSNLLKTIHDSYLDYSNNEKWKRTVNAGTDSTTTVRNRKTGKMEEVPEVNMDWRINKDQIARAIALLPELNPNSAPEYTGIKYNDTWDNGSYRQKNETGITRLLRRSGNSTLEKAATSLEQPGRGTLGGFSYRTTPGGIEISDGYQFAQPSGGYVERSEHTSGYNEERRNMADNYRAANATHQKYFIPWSAYQNIRKNYS